MNEEQAKKLRAPFDPKLIGKLPKPTKRDNPKGKCSECGGWHGLPAVHLDYLGHAAATDRLLEVDPEWTYEFLARNPDGSPVVYTTGLSDASASIGIWIRLMVGGVWTPGFGEGKNFKEAISDGIRNAAMRRGVALDLWSKEDLHASDESAPAPSAVGTGTSGAAGAQASAAPADSTTFTTPAGRAATKAQKKILTDLFTSLGSAKVITEDQFVKAAKGQGATGDGFGECIESLSMMRATDLIARLRNLEKNSAKAA